MKKFISKAFSLVELMVTLIVVSCLFAAMAPVITKKMKSSTVTISNGATSSGGGGSSGECDVVCASNQAKDSSICTCSDCSSLFGEFCLKCDMAKCAECTGVNYLNSGQCIECPDGSYCDGTNKIICPKGFYCVDGEKLQCPSGTYNDSTGASASSDCISCATKTPNCITCDKTTGLCEACDNEYDLTSSGCAISQFLYTYTGSYTETTSTDGKQKIILKSSGTFSALSNKKAKVYLVGAGGAGASCGGGGGGGYVDESSISFQANTIFETVIGQGASWSNGGATQFGANYTAAGGYASTSLTGGSGGGAGGEYAWACTKGEEGVEIDGSWYAGGGAGGGDTHPSTSTESLGGGGACGGSGKGADGKVNTGGGGAGGGWNGDSEKCAASGKGGSGVVIIIVD